MLDLANVSGPALYHCQAGKDRTGWTSMLLQTIAGVPQETIMKDYMASNHYLAVRGFSKNGCKRGSIKSPRCMGR